MESVLVKGTGKIRVCPKNLGLLHEPVPQQGRADANLFILVIAFQAMQVLRTHTKGFGHHDSWTTLRNALRPLQRTATAFARADGKARHLRKTADPIGFQAKIHQAMQIPPPPPGVRRTVVRMPAGNPHERRPEQVRRSLVVSLGFPCHCLQMIFCTVC